MVRLLCLRDRCQREENQTDTAVAPAAAAATEEKKAPEMRLARGTPVLVIMPDHKVRVSLCVT